MTKVHPDFAPIEALPRTRNDLAILPRLDRSGMKSLHLDVPFSTAQRLKSDITGSATQAIAIIARWVLERLEESGQRLVADPQQPDGYRLEPASAPPRIDASMKNSISVSAPGTHPVLASLPPMTHTLLRDECKGSLRRVVMSALEYGLQRLDADHLMLRLSESIEGLAREGRVVLCVGDAGDLDQQQYAERVSWVRNACTTLCWLGFDAVIVGSIGEGEGQADDLLIHFGAAPTGTDVAKETLQIPMHALQVHPASWFALRGEWSVGMPDGLIRRRGKFCRQCGYGESEGPLRQPPRDTTAISETILLCSHCFGMLSH